MSKPHKTPPCHLVAKGTPKAPSMKTATVMREVERVRQARAERYEEVERRIAEGSPRARLVTARIADPDLR